MLVRWRLAIQRGDSRSAFLHAKEISVRYPDDARAQLMLGDAYAELHNKPHAIKRYLEALRLEPGLVPFVLGTLGPAAP